MIGREELTDVVRAKLVTKRLPLDAPERVWVGSGTGLVCSACEQPIPRSEIEYELDTPSHGTLRFHRTCLEVWHQERARPSSR
jgi:hypothetical protein